MHTRHLTVGIGLLLLASVLMAMSTPSTASAQPPAKGPTATRLVTGLEGALGSTIGPDGALYVTEAIPGRISRVDPHTGAITTFASGLPKRVDPNSSFGGAVDVAFLGKTAYVLVSLVSPDVGGSDVDGIYRVDGPDSFTVVADIGTFNVDNPPTIPFPVEVPTGVLYALQTYRGGFLVTDAHLNRVLRVTRDGEITVLIAFDNIVPTGLAVSRYLVYMAEAGPVPHPPEDGKVVAFGPKASTATEVASGASFLLDVEFGPRHHLYALSQGNLPQGGSEVDPALPNTGALVKVNGDGTFTVVLDGLDRPSSLEFIGNTAYVVTLTGEIWKIDGISGRP